jgi:hypothetical protein
MAHTDAQLTAGRETDSVAIVADLEMPFVCGELETWMWGGLGGRRAWYRY